MTNISQAFAFSFSYNINNQNNGGFQSGSYMPTGQDPMAAMMQGFGLMFAGMDMIDNGQIDGSIFQMLAGGPQQQQQVNPYQQQVNPYQQQYQQYPQQYQPQYPQQAQQQNQNPMMQFMMQMMAMLFGMMDIMDDGQMNGSIFQQLLQGMQNQQGYSPYGNNGYNNGYNNGIGWDPIAEMNQIMSGNYQGNNSNSPSNWLYGNNRNNGINGTNGTNGYNQTYNNGGQVNSVNSAPAGTYGGVKLTQEQVNNARIIAQVGAEMGASKRDISIALATAMQESQLKNINYGDRDSVGLFQQRPSCGWGSVAQCTDPRYASQQFYKHLLADKNRHNKSLTQAAQSVQRSAFPNAYAKWENMAVSLTNSITG